MSTEGYVSSRDRGIIIAADVPALEQLGDIVELSSDVPEVVAIKVGFSLTLRFGLRAVVEAVNSLREIPVIYDHQKAGTDIPAMGEPFAVACREAGVKGVILFPQAGPRTLEAFVSAALKHGLTAIVGLTMTHPGYLQSDGGFMSDVAPQTICSLAIANGVRSFVLPGNKTDWVARFVAGPLASVGPVEIMMPGIGAQGGSIKSAFAACSGHCPRAIIGSAIYNSPDPRDALRRFVTEVNA